MELDNIMGKIEGNADKIGMILGAYGELNRYSKEWAQYGIKDPMAAAMNIVQALMENPHMPNLKHVQMALFSDTGMFKGSVIAVIAGWFMKEVDILPQLSKLGAALMKAGIGSAEAAAVINILTYSGAGQSPVWHGPSTSTASRADFVRGL
jgi:ABC-type glucose/galactose transport system permease subunit